MITISPRSTGNGRGIFKDTRRIFFATAGLLAALSAQTTAAPVQLVKTFDKVPDGAYPSGRLLVGLDGAIYGANTQGGTNDHGTLFKVNPNGTGFTVLKQLDSPVTGKNPFGGMVQGPDGTIYGTTVAAARRVARSSKSSRTAPASRSFSSSSITPTAMGRALHCF